jgi:hypothetical protein
MADINTTQMRDALAWTTGDDIKSHETSSNPFVWFWEAVEGDFNEDRSTGQIMVDAAISMIPLVDQLCDMRDLIANCKRLYRDPAEGAAWIALALTLIGLFPTLGSLVKGVLKIFFAFLRRVGAKQVSVAIDGAMTWVITFLRRHEVQKYLAAHKVDEVFKWLSTEIKALRAKVNVGALLAAFDKGIKVVEGLVNKVSLVPMIGKKAKETLEQIKHIRLKADAELAKAVRPVQEMIDTVILRFEREILKKQHGIVDARNIHYRGVLPESAAVALMRKRKPKWITEGSDAVNPGIIPLRVEELVEEKSAKLDDKGRPKPASEIYPELSDGNIRSFHTLRPDTIKGPARLYRVLAPSSRAMSDCWVTEDVFKQLQNSPDPKAAWRKFLAVWPDWNANGQFVIYDIKAGESLNVWRGAAASQVNARLPGVQLEGGYEQIVFNIPRADSRNDAILYYKTTAGKVTTLGAPMTQADVNLATKGMTSMQVKNFYASHLAVREKINHPNITGPFETGWGYTEFDGAGMASKIGIPALPGQITATGG